MSLNYSALLLLFCLSANTLVAQKFSFGPNVGTYISWDHGVNKVNDVVIEIDSDQGDGERFIGAFLNYEILDYLSIKTELNYVPSSAAFIVYDEAEACQFCPVIKAAAISKNALEFFPALKYRIPLFGEKFSINLIAGTSLHFQFSRAAPDVNFNGLHQTVADVINAMDETPRPVVLYFNYGLSVDYHRLSLTGRLQESPGSSFAKDIHINQQRFPFRVKSRYLNLTLSYSFFLHKE